MLDDTGKQVTQTVVPAANRQEILKALHDYPTGGHLSKEKLVGKLRERYYWYGMSTASDKYCKSCVPCKERKTSGPTPVAEMHSIRVTGAFELVSMDIYCSYKVSSKGNRFVLVISEHLTKWVDCYPIANQEAVTIAERFEDYISRYGVPRTLLTDQGRNFESRLFQELCFRYGIEKRTTSA